MPEDSQNSLPVGTVVHDRYRITAIVGRGGLGTVYQVIDILYGKRNIYALKELIDQSPGARKQFELESLWLQSLDHNNIPKVREHFEWQQRMYLVMDFVDGENLEQKLMRQDSRPFSEQQVLQWIMPVCEVLQYLHTRFPPILHRDVKPSNIVVTPEGHVVLVDLGIAKAHLPGANQTSTFIRKAGTEGYAPPEQYAATGQTGPWSDVYSLGATLYQLLTGHVPPTAVERIALDRNLVPLQQISPGISAWVAAAIIRALALRPAERYSSAQDFARALAGPAGRIAGALTPNRWSNSQPSYVRPALQAGAAPEMAGRTPVDSSPSAAPQPSKPMPPSLPTYMSSSPPGGATFSPPRPVTPAPITPISAASTPALGQSRNQQTSQFDRQSSPQLHARAGAAASQRGVEAPDVLAEPRRSPFRSPWVWGIPASVVVLGALLLGAIVYNGSAPPDRSTPQVSVGGYFTALEAQNYTLAWEYSANSYTGAVSESSFIAGLHSDDAHLGRVIQVNQAHMQVQRDSSGEATVEINVTRADTPQDSVTITLIVSLYSGSLWLINSISTP